MSKVLEYMGDADPTPLLMRDNQDIDTVQHPQNCAMLSDHELLLGMRAREAEAGREFVARHAGFIASQVSRHSAQLPHWTKHQSDDATQNIWLGILTRPDLEFERKGTATAYIRTTSRYGVLSEVRRYYTQGDTPYSDRPELFDTLINPVEAEALNEVQPFSSEVADAFEDLTPHERLVCIDVNVHGLKLTEIAANTGLSYANARKIYQRAINKLRARLQQPNEYM